MNTLPFDIKSLHNAYKNGVPIEEVVEVVYKRIEKVADAGIFIHLEDKAKVLKQAQKLGDFDPHARPLWGIPFAVKDNIDARGITTTAGCPDYAYEPEQDAFCVARLREAGALLIGKTNLDQFATGLVGVRSPYTPPKNAIDPELVPGGSSSGSAVSVARGIVSFSLGTDTAGSGRIPAGLNNIVGLKPSLGAVPASGVVPACRTLDTVSVFSLTVDDAYDVYSIINAYDPADAYSRNIYIPGLPPAPPQFRVGAPDEKSRQFFGDELQKTSFETSLTALEKLGAQIIELDFTCLFDVAALLYEGSWVAERYAVIEELVKNNPASLHPVTRTVIAQAEKVSSADVFRDIYRLEELKRPAQALVHSVDLLCVPTMPTFYTVAEVEAEPVQTNSNLGVYTNFVNLLDMCGISVPVAPRSDGLPGSVTLLSSSGGDAGVGAIARILHKASNVKLGATSWEIPEVELQRAKPGPDEIEIAVVGAHMSGLPLNREMTRLGARFLRKSKTADGYKFYALAGGPPKRPGLIKADDGGQIELETWAMPIENFGEFMQGIPHPLGIGTLTLENGDLVKGFICEYAGIEGATEITDFGGWRNYMASLNS